MLAGMSVKQENSITDPGLGLQLEVFVVYLNQYTRDFSDFSQVFRDK